MTEFIFEIKSGMTGLGVFTKKKWDQDAVVFDWSKSGIIAPPDFRTVQVTQDSHILEHTLLRYINHSCDPNIFVDTQNRCCRALRNLFIGEELRFFYPSTEWELSRSFQCNCQSPFCLIEVFGAKNINQELLCKYRLNKHIEILKFSKREFP